MKTTMYKPAEEIGQLILYAYQLLEIESKLHVTYKHIITINVAVVTDRHNIPHLYQCLRTDVKFTT